MVRTILVVALLVMAPRLSWATDADNFLATFKKFGITTGVVSKKPCLCNGGILDRRAGYLVLEQFANNFTFECATPNFNAAGDQVGWAGCDINGGSVLPISK